MDSSHRSSSFGASTSPSASPGADWGDQGTRGTHFRAIFEQAAVGITQADPSGRFIQVNHRFCDLLGYTEAELLQISSFQVTHPEDRDRNQAAIQELLGGGMTSFAQEIRYLCKAGEILWTQVTYSCLTDEQGAPSSLAIVEDITERKQMELELQHQIEQQILFNTIIKDIRESLELQSILDRTVRNLPTVFPHCHGGVALCLDQEPDSLQVMASSVAELDADHPWLISGRAHPPIQTLLTQTDPAVVTDLNPDLLRVCSLLTCHQPLRALLSVGLRLEKQVKGILYIHCAHPHLWTQEEQRLIRQIADHLVVAIQQSELYSQVQAFNLDLEAQVKAHTAQLHQALELESTLRNITDQVRDSLDEQTILQTVVQDLGWALGGLQCFITSYAIDRQIAIPQWEYRRDQAYSLSRSAVIEISEFADLYRPLWQGQMLQFCCYVPLMPQIPICDQQGAILICPIRDDQEILGDIWIIRPAGERFSDLETRLVQQVATQCGIAIRQSRLYDAAQHQVQELERLNQLKDDFISTISHELRTPLTNLRLALRLMNQTDSRQKQQQYYTMAVTECERQIALITDLLNLQRLTTDRYPLRQEPLQLYPWLQELIQPYLSQSHSQGKTLQFDLQDPDADPTLVTDRASLDRILQELLTNACKYTSTGGQIRVRVGLQTRQALSPQPIWIEVANTGELERQELGRVFETFYRVPQTDRWKHPGTGLGLALVRQLVQQLQGEIDVTSQAGWIRFTLWLPLRLEIPDPGQGQATVS